MPSDGDKDSKGYVAYYRGSKPVSVPPSSPTANWDKCRVVIRTGLTGTQVQRTACHEIGHCLGLSHPVTPVLSIMHPTGAQGAVNYISSQDVLNVEEKY